MNKYFPPEQSLEITLGNVSAMWDFSTDFPLPKFPIHCPICKALLVFFRYFRFFKRNEANKTTPYRCDVGTKCYNCSAVLPTFGVVITEELFRLHCPTTDYKKYTFRGFIEYINEKQTTNNQV